MDQNDLSGRQRVCQHENCFFLGFAFLLHAEFGEFDNFKWNLPNFKQFGSVH